MVLPGLTGLVSLLLVDGLGRVQGQEVLLVLGGTDRIHTDGSAPGLHSSWTFHYFVLRMNMTKITNFRWCPLVLWGPWLSWKLLRLAWFSKTCAFSTGTYHCCCFCCCCCCWRCYLLFVVVSCCCYCCCRCFALCIFFPGSLEGRSLVGVWRLVGKLF